MLRTRTQQLQNSATVNLEETKVCLEDLNTSLDQHLYHLHKPPGWQIKLEDTLMNKSVVPSNRSVSSYSQVKVQGARIFLGHLHTN